MSVLDREYAVSDSIREWGRGLGGLDHLRRRRRCEGKALRNLRQVGFGVDGIDTQLLQLSFFVTIHDSGIELECGRDSG
jgi:hypothetical protein